LSPDPTTARVAALIACLALGGCGAIEFYWQGLAGQLDLLARAKPIAEVIDASTDAGLQERLRRTQDIRAFASRDLGLPDNRSYTRYADVGRPYVVWNVFATPELSLAPRQWCFPVAGCVAYRGYFAEGEARAEAARISAAGDDVHVSGVPAYSTLGWLDDPVLSTFVQWREVEIARLIFHELAHQVAYAKDDSSFNESFATAVEEAGLRRWLFAQSTRPDAAQLAADALRACALRAEFRTLASRTRDRLRAIYDATASDEDKRRDKSAAFVAMRADYEAVKSRWGGLPVFDRWFAAGANNAGLTAAALYSDRVPQFAGLLAQDGGDLPRFYARVRVLAALSREQRDAALDAAARAGGECAPAPAVADTRP
jgi:predicted aminopeptidase